MSTASFPPFKADCYKEAISERGLKPDDCPGLLAQARYGYKEAISERGLKPRPGGACPHKLLN